MRQETMMRKGCGAEEVACARCKNNDGALSKNSDERKLNPQRKNDQKSLPKTDGENMLPITNTRSNNNDVRKLSPPRKNNRKSAPETEREYTQKMIDPQQVSPTFQPGRAPVARSMKVRLVSDSRDTFVPLDQPADPFVTDDLIEHDRLVPRWRITALGVLGHCRSGEKASLPLLQNRQLLQRHQMTLLGSL